MAFVAVGLRVEPMRVPLTWVVLVGSMCDLGISMVLVGSLVLWPSVPWLLPGCRPAPVILSACITVYACMYAVYSLNSSRV